MLEFNANTYLLEYQDGAYVCNGNKRVEAPLNLETLEEAVKQCPKLKTVLLDNVPFGDECFSILARASRLDTLALLRGRQITRHGLELLKELPLKYLYLQRTALDDEGLSQAAQIKKLENICIAACYHVTFDGLMAISWRDKLWVEDTNKNDDEGKAGLFTKKQLKTYDDARTYKCMKNQIQLDSQELQAPIIALQKFFNDMTRWELSVDKKDRSNQAEMDALKADLNALFSRQVSWKPRPGWRPADLSWTVGGTYTNHHLIVGERVTKSKYWLYTEDNHFHYRFLLRFIDGKWMIDNVQECWEGRWTFCGL